MRLAGTGWGMRAAVAGVLIVLGRLGRLGSLRQLASPLDFTTDPGAKPDGVAPLVLTPPRQLHSLGGLTGIVEQMKQRFGDTEGFRLVVYPEYASLDRPDPNEDRRQLSYTYRGGWGDPSESSRDDTDKLVDLSKFDAKAVVGVLRGAPETLGMKPGDVTNTYVIIEPTSDETAATRHARRRHVRVERLRQRLHPARRRRPHQADQLPVLTSRWRR